MSVFFKLRPVGNTVPCYQRSGSGAADWTGEYKSVFLDSGTSALSGAVGLAINACETEGKPEVLLPAYGCPDLISAIVAQGASPVLVDFVENRPWLNLEEVRASISKNTVAIIAVNFLGIPERLAELSKIAAEHSIQLIEDSAQCFPPVSVKGEYADSIVLSFGRGKPINLMGGGVLLVRNNTNPGNFAKLSPSKDLSSAGRVVWSFKRFVMNLLMSRLIYSMMTRIRFLRLGETRYKPLETIYKLSGIENQLASGIYNFRERPSHHLEYDRLLGNSKAMAECVLVPLECKANDALFQSRYSFPLLRYPILMKNREERDYMHRILEKHGLGVNAFYGETLPRIEGVVQAVGMNQADNSYPNSHSFSQRLLVLPTHDSVKHSHIVKISRILTREFVAST